MSEPADQLQQWVTFTLHGGEYVVPIIQVLEVMIMDTITPVPQSPEYMAGVINVRGQVIPVVDLTKRFNLEGSVESTGKHIILVEGSAKDSVAGMLVDEVTSISKFTQAQLQPVPTTYQNQPIAPFLQGVFVDESADRLLLAIDLASIIAATADSISTLTSLPTAELLPPVATKPVAATTTESHDL